MADQTWICTYCHKEFNTMLDLDEHMAMDHKKDKTHAQPNPTAASASADRTR